MLLPIQQSIVSCALESVYNCVLAGRLIAVASNMNQLQADVYVEVINVLLFSVNFYTLIWVGPLALMFMSII